MAGVCQISIDGDKVVSIPILGDSDNIQIVSLPNDKDYAFSQSGEEWRELTGVNVSLKSLDDGWLFTDENKTDFELNTSVFIVIIYNLNFYEKYQNDLTRR